MRALTVIVFALMALGLVWAAYQIAASGQALATADKVIKVLRAQVRGLGGRPDA